MNRENEKTFKVMNENGKCYSFTMHSGATVQDATNYANMWNRMAGETSKIAKVWEIEL